ncbi:UDP:flavonoid glycosyltransferase YjiC (YdhE family) [Actinomadura luteofluorescens]|uniref:UDP:flavonoid glycosyltransferase YjiC (YdhE family) n=2 Tax=Actinomadura luteofluorescens TaxID=46163 RepID=A0A7Y9ERM2_9ACTN|nr:nucleotide disphospho-sugar-binding domain-containing protein [Actinomadura luteofluorescens]NYD52534.1 UDP:flavonoid glycosyltransferase YjiC (YdhE family) [Actinomadura luteofluorescens]
MRVMFCSHPGLGHFFPLVHLAWAFRTAGHEVIATIAGPTEGAAGSGVEIVDAAPGFSMEAVNKRLAREHPEFVRTVATKPAINLDEWGPGFAAINRPLIDGIMALTDDWGPDLVVYDQGTTAGLFAAARAGAPAVQRNVSAWRTRGMHEAAAAHLPDVCERYGVTISKPAVTIEEFPPSMLAGERPEGWFMRWLPHSGGSVVGDRLLQPPERRRVAVSMGTVELQMLGTGTMRTIIDAAAGVDAEFVLALGGVDIGSLGPLPDNVSSVGWIPLHHLLATCTAIVHHGGGGTALTAIDAGVPQLITPDPRDLFQHTTLEAVRKRGIGFVSEREDVDADLLTRLMTDEGVRAATAEVQREMATLPTPAETAQRIIEHLF